MSGLNVASQHGDIADAERKFSFPRTTVGGLPVAVLDREETAQLTISAALSRRGSGRPCLFFTTVNGQVVSLCGSRPSVKRLYEGADLISADGMSVVFASRLLTGISLPERVCTTDAFHDAARLAENVGASFYFFGGTEEVNARTVDRVRELYPRLRIAGRRNGYFAGKDEPAVADSINVAAPDVLWIGLGVPHQQQFIHANHARLTSVGLAKTCGGLFDFLSEKSRRAPLWVQKRGFEWAFRLLEEPRRLAWRYLKTNPHAFYLMLARSGKPAGEGILDISAQI